MSAAVRAVLHRFADLDTMIDELHALFKEWDERGTFYPPVDALALERARLATHEWLANLVQHADFAERSPEVLLCCRVCDDRLGFTIEDNSSGFDISRRNGSGPDILKVFPERGMGLAFVERCTEDLSYREVDDGRHVMEFYVATE